ncbi:hypothetical protein HF072_03770 [Bacillus sp. RO3]|nr:hypothetical protein [Bacillus sp. RO3]
MSGWRKLEQEMVEMETFYLPEDLRLYVWILLNATYQGGVQIGGVVLGERQYVRDQPGGVVNGRAVRQTEKHPKLTINSPKYLEKVLEVYISPRESMQRLDDMLDCLEESIEGA